MLDFAVATKSISGDDYDNINKNNRNNNNKTNKNSKDANSDICCCFADFIMEKFKKSDQHTKEEEEDDEKEEENDIIGCEKKKKKNSELEHSEWTPESKGSSATITRKDSLSSQDCESFTPPVMKNKEKTFIKPRHHQNKEKVMATEEVIASLNYCINRYFKIFFFSFLFFFNYFFNDLEWSLLLLLFVQLFVLV